MSGPDNYYFDEYDEELNEPLLTCILCSCIIGDEVGLRKDSYDYFPEGPICDGCLDSWDETDKQ